MTLEFNKLKKYFQTDQSVVSLLGWCEHFAQITRWEGEGQKCSHVDVEKYKQIFCFPCQSDFDSDFIWSAILSWIW